MDRLWKIALKLVISITVAIAILCKSGDTFSDSFSGLGAFSTFLGTIGVIIILVGMIYTAITIFMFCFINENFVLWVDGFPLPFVTKIIAGFAGLLVWAWVASFLEHQFGGNIKLVDIILLFVYYPMFLWIDLVVLFIEERI